MKPKIKGPGNLQQNLQNALESSYARQQYDNPNLAIQQSNSKL